jgi:quinol monooxygenase YgiN
MIVVHGSIVAKPQHAAALLNLCKTHVHRVRTEPGCLANELHHDTDNPLRLVFVERWSSKDALMAHFAQPASRDFIKRMGAMVAELPSLKMYAAEELTLSVC